MQLFNIYKKSKASPEYKISFLENLLSSQVKEALAALQKQGKADQYKVERSKVIKEQNTYKTKEKYMSEHPSKLVIMHNGDSSVGELGEQWEIEVPFDVDEAEWETLEEFRESAKALYQGYTDFRLQAIYDYELKMQDDI